MTQEQKRIKLAEASKGIIEFYEDVWYYWDYEARRHPCKNNDPLEDLNAVHELVMSQPKEVRSRFRKELEWLIAPSTKPCKVSGIQLMNVENYDQWFHATAAQRCEALGLTLNLWK